MCFSSPPPLRASPGQWDLCCPFSLQAGRSAWARGLGPLRGPLSTEVTWRRSAISSQPGPEALRPRICTESVMRGSLEKTCSGYFVRDERTRV